MDKTAGIIIIGDEVLSGKVVDTNSSYLCKQFYSLGIRVCRISTIPDQVLAIKSEVKTFSDLFDVVITTGGVGPTHDDVTYESVADAFGESLRRDAKMERIFASYLKENPDPAALKFVTVPKSAEIVLAGNVEPRLLHGVDYYPIAKVRNVFCLPGVPKYLRAIFPALVPKYFEGSKRVCFSRAIYLNVDEICAVTVLNELVEKFANSVTFGSYPLMGDMKIEDAETKITVESTALDDCLEAEKVFISRIPPSWLTFPKVETTDFPLIERLITIETELSNVVLKSFQIIEQCIEKFNIDETFISFNGGKDCTVLLNLVYSFCMQKKLKQRLKLLYFQEVGAFHEVDEFIDDIAKSYDVDVCTLPMPMKDSLSVFLSREPNRKACFMGLRNTDPKSEDMYPIQETDSDWPKVVRLSPLLHWSYKNIWDFLRCANVPYCSLYNKGYSSLGGKNNTLPNPALRFTSEDGEVHYRPAFFLEDNRFERQGRSSATNGDVA